MPNELVELAGVLPTIPALALNRKQAAEALNISERLLWSWTNQGLIKCARIGKRVVYPVSLLKEFLEEQAAKGRHRQ